MAKLTRDTARRSIEDLLGALPATATIDLTKVGTPPPRGTAVVVKISVTEVAAAEIGKRPGMSKANPRDSGAPDFRGLKSGRSENPPKADGKKGSKKRGEKGSEKGEKAKEADAGQGPGGRD